MSHTSAQTHAILLAAGKGTRMRSDLPKVVHEVNGRPMIRWVVDACRRAGVTHVVVVVGYRADAVRAALEPDLEAGDLRIAFAEQAEQLGTGHAARMAAPAFDAVDPGDDVLVMCGDGPLITADTLGRVLAAHAAADADATLATAELDDPTGYGRVLRDSDGRFERIVEQKDATPEQLAVREVNPSYYAFRVGPLFEQLARLSNDNAQGEYYLTDVPGQLRDAGRTVAVEAAVPADQVLGINTPEDLARVDGILRDRQAASAAD